jgi:UTP--glucose-1-phosphate uridylyltransferase
MFPVVGKDGRTKPVIMAIVEEVMDSGIDEVAIIIQEDDRALFEDFFHQRLPVEHYNKLSKDDQKYMQRIMDMGSKITLITQETQDGFGHAVYCANEWVGNEPFILLLGDHLYGSDTSVSCTRQLIDVYERTGKSVVGLQETPVDEVQHFGCATGIWEEKDCMLSITEFAEKPSPEYAREHLVTQDVKEDHFLTLFGQYILTPRIFELLAENINRNMREGGEFQLTTCMDKLRQEEGFIGCRVKGRRFDIGIPEAYRQTIIDYRNA